MDVTVQGLEFGFDFGVQVHGVNCKGMVPSLSPVMQGFRFGLWRRLSQVTDLLERQWPVSTSAVVQYFAKVLIPCFQTDGLPRMKRHNAPSANRRGATSLLHIRHIY